MLKFNIYGLKVGIDCSSSTEEKEIADLLEFFIIYEEEEGLDLKVRFEKQQLPQEIGSILFPHLAHMGIYPLHAACMNSSGGILIVGPSDSGKSTFSRAAYKLGIPLLCDDIALLKPTSDGLKILPFYSYIKLDGDIVARPEVHFFQGIDLNIIAFPIPIMGLTVLKKITEKFEIFRRLVPQILWSMDYRVQSIQKEILLKLCEYPVFEICWDLNSREDMSYFEGMINDIVQG